MSRRPADIALAAKADKRRTSTLDKQLELEDLIPLEDVCRKLPMHLHRSTIYRWAQKGRRGVRLRVVSVGSKRCTTESWLMEFFDAVEKARPNGNTPSKRRRQPRASHAKRHPRDISELAMQTELTLRQHGLFPEGTLPLPTNKRTE